MAIPNVALVFDGGAPVGRAIALELAARGAKVVVAGADERALGETVGEIAFGGGKARHVVGSVEAGRARALEVFGPVDLVATVADAQIELRGGDRVTVVPAGAREPEAIAHLVITAIDG